METIIYGERQYILLRNRKKMNVLAHTRFQIFVSSQKNGTKIFFFEVAHTL